MVRAGVYARISSDREGDNLAIGRQVADCEALAERRGWTVVERYVDADVSAWGGKRRPEYERLSEEIEAGLIDALVVYHADRLHRHPRELEEFMALCERLRFWKIATVSGDLDLGTHDGQLMARMLGAFARKESDDKSRRISRKHEEIAAQGRPSGGGTRPFGYESDHRTVRPAEAAIIRECAARALAGDSLRSICIDLNDRGVATVKGARWVPQTLKRMLVSGRISGQRERKGEIVAKADWEGIISPVETERLRAKLRDPARRTNRSARRYLLPRLLRCGLCNGKLYAQPRADGTRRYVCKGGPVGGCGKITIVAEPVELFTVEAVLHRLDSPEFAASLNGRRHEDGEAAGWQTEIEQADEKLAELADLWARDEISRAEWLKAADTIRQRQDVARKRLGALNRTSAIAEHVGNAEDLRRRWDGLTLSRQQQIVAAVLDHLHVGPGRPGLNRFDYTRLTPVWRA